MDTAHAHASKFSEIHSNCNEQRSGASAAVVASPALPRMELLCAVVSSPRCHNSLSLVSHHHLHHFFFSFEQVAFSSVEDGRVSGAFFFLAKQISGGFSVHLSVLTTPTSLPISRWSSTAVRRRLSVLIILLFMFVSKGDCSWDDFTCIHDCSGQRRRRADELTTIDWDGSIQTAPIWGGGRKSIPKEKKRERNAY